MTSIRIQIPVSIIGILAMAVATGDFAAEGHSFETGLMAIAGALFGLRLGFLFAEANKNSD